MMTPPLEESQEKPLTLSVLWLFSICKMGWETELAFIEVMKNEDL